MLSAAFGVFSFLKSNLKWVVMGIAVVAISLFAYHYYKTVRNLATAQYTIEQLEQNVEDNKKAIEFERDLRELLEQAMLEFQKENEKLREELENVGIDLGEDSESVAPESLREILKRLRDLTP